MEVIPASLIKTLMNKHKDVLPKLSSHRLTRLCYLFIRFIVRQVMKGERVVLMGVMTFKRVLKKERGYVLPTKKGQKVRRIVKPAHYAFGMEVKRDLKYRLAFIPTGDEN